MNTHTQDLEQNEEIITRENEARPILKRTIAGKDNVKTQAVISELVQTRRGLNQRHIQMIALAGTIGTGLFLATGKSLARGGPLSMLLAYCIVGMLICCVVFSVAELSALVPLSGGIIRHAEWFVDPALAFAQGWNSVYANAILLPAEMVACAVIIDFWSHINHAVWISALGALLVISNMLLVSIYGELEFVFAMLKIALIVGVNILSICITSGAGPQGYPMGFRFWRDPGPFVQFLGIGGSLGRFLGFWRVLSSAAYAFSNVENISVAAAETQNPRHNIPKAAKRVFWRILIFYLITIFMMGLIVPSNDKGLLSNSGDAGASPFAIAATNVGIKVVPSIINAIVVTSAWSAAMLVGTRTLYGLAQEGHAPKVFTRINRFGVPWISVAAVGSFLVLGYMTLSSAASLVFDWLQQLVSAASLVHWINIEVVYLRFFYGCKKQKINRTELPWKSPFQPYAAWAALVSFSIILVTGGFYVFIEGNWSSQTFVSSYFNIPLICVLFFGYKFWRKTRLVPLGEIPIREFLHIANDHPEPIPSPATGWRRTDILWA
ncbi:Amino acid/polyamine transporter I [Penicillium coprophilum]|uniref:Amino acid/polyamine transporter I n=1 Tax=Penicillium coprophilum TaxID=36646 RepID=UPI002386F445|nr:Amino acid/polyamine transporter I [Penicillium coprophilum]KAJ5170691.1 Amino acid/polyamine transporter I [Penicillium coprophilum]